MKKLITVLGARPQFIKAAPVSEALRQCGFKEILVHTGQHYDYKMSQIFFDELDIPHPDINLEIGSGSHGRQTGLMLSKLEEVMQSQKPDQVLVYGDTNSTLAAAIAACKLQIPLVHIEAGLRSYNKTMPEEHNRVLTDHCSDVLFCPTQTAVENLANEGIRRRVYLVGDTMADSIAKNIGIFENRTSILRRLNVRFQAYSLLTLHRPSNTDNKSNLQNILQALGKIKERIIFAVHPRTRKKLEEFGLIDELKTSGNLHLIDPLGYPDMITLMKAARRILTDSGGMQKEAYCLKVPCITLREETEWVETLNAGWNVLVGANSHKILEAVQSSFPSGAHPPLYGDGKASEKIVQTLCRI